MESRRSSFGFKAASGIAVLFGILVGLGGLVHGIGEILQGNQAPDALVFISWATGPIATRMGGEPAMSLIPNLLASGIITCLVSLGIILWSAVFVQRRQGGLILLFLSIALLLTGGGFAPPIIGILASAAGMGIHSTHNWWRTHLPVPIRQFLGKCWPAVFIVCAVNGIFLVVGSVILVTFFGLNQPQLFVYSFLFAIASLIICNFLAIAYDVQHGPQAAIA